MTWVSDDYTVMTPNCCGRSFALPAARVRWLKESNETFWCPNCRGNRYFPPGSSDKEKLERKLKRAEEERNAARSRHLAERRSHIATKGHLTRKKKRAAAGVCPCCNRTFKQLAEHMQTKHPDYGSNQPTGGRG